MAAVDFTDFDNEAAPREFGVPSVTIKNTCDFSANAADAASAAVDIPAGAFVHWVAAKVTTVEGDAVNFTLGDGTDADGWLTATSANTAATTINVGAYVTTNGKLYSAADTIDITPASELDAAVIEVIVNYTKI